MSETRQTYHIIGGGIAGLCCAKFIKQKNPEIRTVVYEAGEKIGGRCYSYDDKDLGCRLDNATHVIIGANKNAAGLLGKPDWQKQCWFWDAAANTLSRDLRRHSGHILKSMCNTPAEQVPQSMVKKILWKLFPWTPGQRKVYFSKQDLSQYLINPLLAQVDELYLNKKLVKIDSQFGRAVQLTFGDGMVDIGADDKVILALDSRGYHALLGGESFEYNSIINIVYKTSQTITLPRGARYVAVVNGLADWIFVSENLVGATISAVPPETARLDELARQIWRELDGLRGVNSAFVPSFKVFNHKIATIRQDAANNAKRPDSAESIYPNVFLAGDWTMKDLPCSIETAILSAKRAVKTAAKSQ